MGFRNIKQNRILSSLILLAMTLAVLAKALVPAGFMPNEDMTAMVICSGMGEKTVMVPSGEENPSDQGKAEACAYYLAAIQKIVPVILAALPVAANPQIPHETVLEKQFTAEPFITAFSSRGPPLPV